MMMFSVSERNRDHGVSLGDDLFEILERGKN